jgi:hypothetical protein
MTSIEPVREGTRADAQGETPSPAATFIDGMMNAIDKTNLAARKSAAANLRRTADLIETIAGNENKIARLIASIRKIPNQKTRDAAIEALGFDYETAVGFGLRVANRWKIFKHGQAAMHKRRPVTVREARGTLLYRARQLRIMANVFAGSTMGDAIENRRMRSSITRLAGDGATVTLDLLSCNHDVLGPLGGIALAAASETENDIRWEFEKLIALTPATTIQDLENARADYNKGYAKNRIGLILCALPFSGTATSLLGALTPDGRQELGRQLSLHDLIEESARS